tara:strand:- start:2047 stop:2532 length:486 start_codon:yes stop_codon:yes gene_type:complete
MFSDPQFWVAVSFILFIAAIFNPVRKMLVSSLDAQISEIKTKIEEAENLKNEAQKTLSELKKREAEVEKEIEKFKTDAENKISELKNLSSKKLSDQIEKKKILADNRIEQLLRDTNQNIKSYIADIAIEAITDILKTSLSKDKKAELINDSINDLNRVLKN